MEKVSTLDPKLTLRTGTKVVNHVHQKGNPTFFCPDKRRRDSHPHQQGCVRHVVRGSNPGHHQGNQCDCKDPPGHDKDRDCDHNLGRNKVEMTTDKSGSKAIVVVAMTREDRMPMLWKEPQGLIQGSAPLSLNSRDSSACLWNKKSSRDMHDPTQETHVFFQ